MAASCAGMLAATAGADEDSSTPSETESVDAIAEVAPEVFADVHQDINVSQGTASADIGTTSEEASTVTLDASSSSLTIEGWDDQNLSISLKSSDTLPVESEITSDGSLFAEHEPGVSATTLMKEDGSVQVVSTIAGPGSATRLEYEVSANGLASIDQVGDALIFRDSGDGFLGAVTAPWAKDANGLEVPTRFEISGTSFVQIVDHTSAEYAYPIVADPVAGIHIFHTVDLLPSKHVARPTPFAWALRGSVTPTGYQWGWRVLMADGWDEFYAKTNGKQYINQSIVQQYYCHATYMGDPFSNPTWDLETYRPILSNNTMWYAVWQHGCNWNYSNGNV